MTNLPAWQVVTSSEAPSRCSSAGKSAVWAARSGPGPAVPLRDGAGAESAGAVSVVMRHLVSTWEITNPVRTIGAHRERQRVKRFTERGSVRWDFRGGPLLRRRWARTR